MIKVWNLQYAAFPLPFLKNTEARDVTIVECGCTLPQPYHSQKISMYSHEISILHFLTTAYLQNLTKILLVEKNMLSLRLALNTGNRLISHRDLLRLLGSWPLRGDAVDALVNHLKTVATPIFNSTTEDLALWIRFFKVSTH